MGDYGAAESVCPCDAWVHRPVKRVSYFTAVSPGTMRQSLEPHLQSCAAAAPRLKSDFDLLRHELALRYGERASPP